MNVTFYLLFLSKLGPSAMDLYGVSEAEDFCADDSLFPPLLFEEEIYLWISIMYTDSHLLMFIQQSNHVEFTSVKYCLVIWKIPIFVIKN